MRIKRCFAEAILTDPVRAMVKMVYERVALEACAQATGISHQTLSKQLNESDDNQISLRRAAAIEQFLDSDLLAECFAARRGGIFVKLPALPSGAAPELLQGYSRLIGEFADASRAFSDAVADGKVDAEEVARFAKELRDVYVAGERLVLAAAARVSEG